MSTECELCGHSRPMLPFYTTHRIVTWPIRDFVFYDGRGVADDLDTERYFTGGEYLNYLADKAVIQRNFQRRVCEILRVGPRGDPFEIGSAYGLLLELARGH